MKTLMTIFLVAMTLSLAAKDHKPDSLRSSEHFETLVNREFVSLTPDGVLAQLESKYGTKLNSIAKCLVLFSRANLEKDQVNRLKLRIQEIAIRFFNEGKPIYLSIGGSQSAEWADGQNNKRNNHNLTFVSFGNYCVVEKGEREFESIFNKKTLELLGLENVE